MTPKRQGSSLFSDAARRASIFFRQKAAKYRVTRCTRNVTSWSDGEQRGLGRRTKASGGRILSVGTTTLRVLESVAKDRGAVIPDSGRTSIFIYPPYSFKVNDALLTNLHLPRSTLLMLVSAFASPGRTNGREAILGAYAEAIHHHYRFFSYGDAMLIV